MSCLPLPVHQPPLFNDITNADADVPNESEEMASAWMVALPPLVEGKMTMDKVGMSALGKVERASDHLVDLGIFKVRFDTLVSGQYAS